MNLTPKDIKLIAFYLPQFHPIPENNEWWGEGFTEWTNVRKAKPHFPGHYQPHIPGQLGYYDLRDSETRVAQAELARAYGIHGFCYYHYWFNGKRLLETPFNEVLRSGKPDFPFCLCWANENWTRRWDGAEKDVLIEQHYSHEDDLNFINDLVPAFRDERYIRVDDKPILIVYRTGLLPDPCRTAAIWREAMLKAGIGDIYLVRVENSSDGMEVDPKEIGFDAAVEFAPYWKSIGGRINTENGKIEQMADTEGGPWFYDYVHCMAEMLQRELPEYKFFRGVFPMWDNSPRRKDDATVFIESSPEKYRFWLSWIIRQTVNRYRPEERLIFINAWNEWGEGCNLEPDVKYGTRYLAATRDALLLQHHAFDMSELSHVDGHMLLKIITQTDEIYAEAIRKIHSNEVDTLELINTKIELENKKIELEYTKKILNEVINTKSWKMTAPLRNILSICSRSSSKPSDR